MIYLVLFLEFFKIGLFCFGGAFGMIPLIRETVLAHGWLTEARFYDLIGVCESTPGPIAVNMATYIGATQGGVLGSAVATLGVVLPSFVIILLIASALKGVTEHPLFKGFIKGVQPVIIAMILSTGAVLLLKAAGLTGGAFALNPVTVTILVLLVTADGLRKHKTGKKIPAVQLILLSAGLGLAVSACAGLLK